MVTAQNPAEVVASIFRFVSGQDLDGALTLYEPEASMEAPEPGQTAKGIGGVREALANLLTLKPELAGKVTRVVEADDIALVCGEWTLEGTRPDGAGVSMHGKSADVVRRQADGTWLFIIDNPWGTDVPSATSH